MDIPLHSLDIDKYVKWYKDLSYLIDDLADKKERYNRYCLASFKLFSRHVIDSNNLKSLSGSEKCMTSAKALEIEIKEIEVFAALSDVYYLPTLLEWETIEVLRKSAFETDLNDYITSRDRSPVSEMQFAREQLQRIESESRPNWLDSANAGKPLLKDRDNAIRFPIGLAFIDFAKYLHQKISDLELGLSNSLPSVSSESIVWQGKSIELFTLFADMKKCGLIEGRNSDIARIICNNFKSNDGKRFTFSDVQNKLNNNPNSKKRADFSDFT